MEEIYKNITSLSWWFTGVFFILLGIAFSKLFKSIPKLAKSYARQLKAKQLKTIRHKRWNQSAVNYQIIKTWSIFIIFCLIIACYIVASLASNFLQTLFEINPFLGWIFTSPIYVLELLWLFQQNRCELLIALQERIRKNNS